MKQCGFSSQIHNQRGGVLLEFSVIVPVLLFICFGLVDIGQAFSQKAWLESVAFQSVMMGGELQEQRPASMRNISNQLVDILHVKLDKKFVTPDSVTSATEDETERTVTSTVPGEMRMVSNIVKIPYRVSLTGPILVRTGDPSLELDPQPINDGTNGTNTYYDCYGTKIAVGTEVTGGGCNGPSNNTACRCACIGGGLGNGDTGCY